MASILIVDDDDDIRDTLVDLMRSKGHQVSGVADGADALTLAAASRPDLLVTDIIMPDKDGIQTIIEMRKLYKDIPVIAMSGGGKIPASVYLAHARAAGEMTTLEKPFKVTAFVKAVENAMCH